MSNKTEYQIRTVMKDNRDGSPNRQTTRLRHLKMFMEALQQRGYSKRWDIHRLGALEVHRVVADWRAAELDHRTIANRMVSIRWLARKVGRADQIPSNQQLGIPSRGNLIPVNKAEPLDREALARLGEREQLITELRAWFGLRTEEACKFDYVVLARKPKCDIVAD